jgi:soluble lytic murein transglycosylase-like protein
MLNVILLSALLGQMTPIYSPTRVREVVLERAHLLGSPISDMEADVLAASVINNHRAVPVPLTLAVIEIESKYVRKAKSTKSCKGYMQLSGGTARTIAKRLQLNAYDTYHARDNILLGTYYLKLLTEEQKGDQAKALTIYNAGWGGYVARKKKISGYAKAVLARAKKLAHLLTTDLFCGKPLTTNN